MDSLLATASIQRARAALDLAFDAHQGRTVAAQAKSFRELAWLTLKAGEPANVLDALERAASATLRAKSGAAVLGIASDADIRALAAAYVSTLAPVSILDALVAAGARVLPRIGRGRLLIATDAVGDIVAEGDPKPAVQIDLALAGIAPTKSAGIVVMTRELADIGGPEVVQMFESELAGAVGRATNAAALGSMLDTNVIGVAAIGDPLTDLRAGLRAAPASAGFVAVAAPGAVADLATRVENVGGMGPQGGRFAPGVFVVADATVQAMYVLPASRAAVFDRGLVVRSAGHASVDMRATPSSPAEQVSLWQTGSVALLIEREWAVLAAEPAVIVI
jgi:hypothetical protein